MSDSTSFPPAAPELLVKPSPDPVPPPGPARGGAKKPPRRTADVSNHKRRCISTACIACRKRKSKCDGALPSCAACASVYGTDCIYDPNSDHRRKGVYRERNDSIKARSSTLQTIVEAILKAPEDEVPEIVRKVRACDHLDIVAQQLAAAAALDGSRAPSPEMADDESNEALYTPIHGESELARKMGELRVENGSVRFIGGTSHLIYLDNPADDAQPDSDLQLSSRMDRNPITSWSSVTNDVHLITHLIDMYFNYHYPYFTTLSKKLFWRDFAKGASGVSRDATAHCSPLLVNAMLALGCHFSDLPGAYAVPGDGRTKGDHFFDEAKSLILTNDEFAKPRLDTVQALALMSVREAGCAREAKGWVYSGMSFRMAQDLGLNLEIHGASKKLMSDEEIDARKITFWGCFLFDKCWSNYLGRLPQLPKSGSNVSKFDVFPDEDAETWYPLTDKGRSTSYQQPWRTRASALQLSSLSEISSDLLIFFYHPNHIGRSRGKSTELKMLGEIHQRLEEWRKQLPKEFEPREGQLPNVILMHMFFHLQYIHLFRPFLKYATEDSPLPGHVSPRRICTSNAGAISKLTRLYSKAYKLRQICNIAVYMIHSACTIHLLNLPEKSAKRDISHGIKHLEEIAEDWPCARRTLSMLSVLARKWRCELPDDAVHTLKRADEKYGYFNGSDISSPGSSAVSVMVSDEDDTLVPGKETSPLSHYTHAHMSHFTPPSASLDSHMPMMPPALQMMGGGPRLGPQHNQDFPFDAGRMDFNPDVLNGWASQPTSMPEPRYQSPILAMNGGGTVPDGSSEPGSRHVSPGQGAAFVNQRWMVNDGTRWQQNLEGWGMGVGTGVGTGVGAGVGAGVSGGPVFMFGNNRDDGMHQGTPNAGAQGRAGMEDLVGHANNKVWLPDLE